MTIVEILAGVLSEAAKNEGIPNIRFKMNNSLGEEVTKLISGGDSSPSGESDTDSINRFMAEIAGAVDNETGEAKTLDGVVFSNEVCETISDAIANHMKSSTERLRNIHKEVTTLSERIKETYNKIIGSDPFLAKHVSDNSQVKFDFPEMRYDVLNELGGIKNTTAYVISEVDGEESAMSVKSKFINVIGKFAARKLNAETLPKITVDSKIRTEIVNAICEDDDSILPGNLDAIAKVVFSTQALGSVAKRLVATFEKDSGTDATVRGLSTISDYRKNSVKLAEALEEKGIEVPEATLQFINDLTDLCGYVVQYHRINTFNTTVLFRTRTLNPDLKPEMEKRNLSMQDLAQHVQYRYKDYELPGVGVSIDSLEQSKERIDKDVAKMESQNKVRIDAGLHDATHKAFISTMTDYLRQDDVKEQVGNAEDFKSYLISCANKITNEGASSEDVIYLIMENVLYRNDFVMVLREKLGMSYVKAVASNEELSADDMAEVNAVVYARLITEYMKSQFMEIEEV